MIKLLHVLSPEKAHKMALWSLKNGIGPYVEHKADLSFNFLGKTVQNPIGLAGGADKKAEALEGWALMGFGIVEVGTITKNAREGNPTPRVWRLKDEKDSLVNWMGLPGPGYEPVIENLKKFQQSSQRKNLLVGASIASPDGILSEFSELAGYCRPYVDYITLNASCPNVTHGPNVSKVIFSQIEEAKKGAGNLPLLVKLAPTKDKEALALMVNGALEAGANGFVATNTLPSADRDLAHNLNIRWPSHDAKPVGGYSGQKLLPIACFMVKEIRKMVGPDKPIIGVGGVQTGNNALALMKAGADAIQLYTGLIYKGPALIKQIGEVLANR